MTTSEGPPMGGRDVTGVVAADALTLESLTPDGDVQGSY